MGILGIRNRTENWRTAQYFAPLFENGRARLRLVECLLGEPTDISPDEVRVELFWRGMRDHLHPEGKQDSDDKDFAKRYRRLFPDLRNRVEEFITQAPGSLRTLEDWNYCPTAEHVPNLGNNLFNTEVDVVLESPGHLFIGEAKHEMSFHASSSLVLVHQLIRQYVMARILVDRLERRREVIPFVVGEDADNLRKRGQVKFMVWNGWLREGNVLSWRDIVRLAT